MHAQRQTIARLAIVLERRRLARLPSPLAAASIALASSSASRSASVMPCAEIGSLKWLASPTRAQPGPHGWRRYETSPAKPCRRPTRRADFTASTRSGAACGEHAHEPVIGLGAQLGEEARARRARPHADQTVVGRDEATARAGAVRELEVGREASSLRSSRRPRRSRRCRGAPPAHRRRAPPPNGCRRRRR